jgi:hypothetical protein
MRMADLARDDAHVLSRSQVRNLRKRQRKLRDAMDDAQLPDYSE